MKFFRDLKSDTTHSRSDCGYYFVTYVRTDPANTRYAAEFNRAVWERHTRISEHDSPEQAQHACEAHRNAETSKFVLSQQEPGPL